jgi:hypothetical protein
MIPVARRLDKGLALKIAAVVAVFAAIGAGLVVLGSPADVRARRLDEQRIEHLREWTRAIDAYWTANNQLPVSLDEVRRQQAWTHLTVNDPETGQPYVYQAKGAVAYELCAVFERASPDTGRPDEDALWGHGAGPACFTLEARR